MPWTVLLSTIARPMVAIIGARCGAWRARSGANMNLSSSQPAPAVTSIATKTAASQRQLE